MPPSRPYSELTISVPTETLPGERRVALSPASVAQLKKKGFKDVVVARGAGEHASFTDDMYTSAGAKLGDGWAGDVVLKVRPPSPSELAVLANSDPEQLRTLISFMYPAQNPQIVQALQEKGWTGFGMDCVPRISRAQSMDALSSMANIAGYRAIVEASNEYGRFLGGLVTAGGKVPASKVMVIGAGVAGLSAIGTAKRLGAVVRGFDTRAAAKEQVESMGAQFLTVDIQESGDGGGGYAKEMSPVSAEGPLVAPC